MSFERISPRRVVYVELRFTIQAQHYFACGERHAESMEAVIKSLTSN